jgi:ferredoxin-NADP reductase
MLDITKIMQVKHTVKEVSNLTPSIIGLVLERDPDQQMYTFQPGQYVTISFMSKGSIRQNVVSQYLVHRLIKIL